MHRQTEILQDRIEIAALGRHLGQPPKRTRCEEDEEVEGRRDPGLHRQHVGLEGRRQIDAEQRDQCAEYGEDQHPQQHRALVVAPNAGDLVDQRHLRMRVLVNNGDREVRRISATSPMRAPVTGEVDWISANASASTSA
jgi:hypothetical protein